MPMLCLSCWFLICMNSTNRLNIYIEYKKQKKNNSTTKDKPRTVSDQETGRGGRFGRIRPGVRQLALGQFAKEKSDYMGG